MIGDHQIVEWAQQAGANAGARSDDLALREAVGLVRAKSVSEHTCVGGIGGVHVGVAKEHLIRIIVVQVGGVFTLGRFNRPRVTRVLRGDWQAAPGCNDGNEGEGFEAGVPFHVLLSLMNSDLVFYVI
jgi:hypothetical protein